MKIDNKIKQEIINKISKSFAHQAGEELVEIICSKVFCEIEEYKSGPIIIDDNINIEINNIEGD